MITVLTGGTGGAKFVDGLQRVVPADQLTIIVNTGDDHEWWGLYVSPDVDSIMYVLSGLLSPERGWGVRGDTFHCLDQMKKLGEDTWFSVGDRDLATHLLRTKLLSQGRTLSEVTQEIAKRLGIRQRILPMSDQRVETRIGTPVGELSFEEYFVKRWYQDPVESVRFAGASETEPAPGVVDAIASADAVLIAPSNPVTSIGPILAVPGIREALRKTSAPVVAVSPIIGNAAVSGPAANLMAAQGLDVSIAGVAHAYSDFLDILLAHKSDLDIAKTVNAANLQIHCANILMCTVEDRTRVAATALSLVCPQMAGVPAVEAV
jgi:LPPG:FO 2-phospho-L-lactate transferase